MSRSRPPPGRGRGDTRDCFRTGPSRTGFVTVNVAPGCIVVTDGWPSAAVHPLLSLGSQPPPTTYNPLYGLALTG